MSNVVVRELKRYPLSYGVLLILLVPFLLLLAGGLEAVSHFLMPPLSTSLVVREYALLWSVSAVHFSVGHFISNGFIWWLLARAIEAKSRTALLMLCLIVPALSNYAEWRLAGPEFGGLSGLDYGLLGYIVVLRRFGSSQTPDVDPIVVILMLVALPVAATGLIGSYANYAHLVGLVSGALVALICLATATTSNT